MKNLLTTVCILGGLVLSTLRLEAHPYASGVTNNNGTIQFILNEPADNVYVVFEDGSTNTMGQQTNSGLKTFALGTHTNYLIYVTKVGNGVPVQISSDSNPWNVWNSPRGVAVNPNPQIGYLFGRVYIANSAIGGSGANAKRQGLYMFNADMSDSPELRGTNAYPSGFWAASTSSPFRLSVAPDNSVIVGDYSTAAATVWQFDGDFLSVTNQMLAILGENTGAAAGIHGDIHGHPIVTGSVATSNLVLWTADEKLTTVASNSLGYNTPVGNVDNVLRYTIGAGPLPWANPPDLGLAIWPGIGIADLGQTDVAIHRQTGNIFAMGERSNYGNPNLQVFDPTGTTRLFTSLEGPVNIGPDPLLVSYSLDVSPDGQFVALANINNAIYVMTLTNGVPDITTLLTIPNTPTTGNNRGVGFDAADNIYAVSSGQGLNRIFSLGLTTTAITGNDATGTNGTFQLVLPAVSASVVATTPVGSQNYGSPTPGVFTIELNTNFLASATVVNFVLGGSATNGTYIASVTNSVTFPAGAAPGGSNWTTNITITPTATPASGPTMDVTLTVTGGAAYLAHSPVVDTVAIANTGPNVISISGSGSTMYRGLTNDYATFTITRLGDTNGPAPSHSPSTLTITNFIYGGQAVFGSDYLAGVQAVPSTVRSSPVNGTVGITFNPGDVTQKVIIGNPVRTPTGSPAVGNESITVTLGATNGLEAVSTEGYVYEIVTNSAITLTEIDNAYPPEIVLWSNPLTNAADSTNWTVTFAASNSTALPVVPPTVITNYVDDVYGGPTYTNDFNGTNDFDVEFGYNIANDRIGPSPDMLANGWATALKVTANEDPGYMQACGVNALLQGKNFAGNYAVRFTMNLSQGTYYPTEFALFGMDHFGTNCDWENNPFSASTYTNQDGNWWAVSAGIGGSITPADYDMFTGGFGFPNGGRIETDSSPSAGFTNVFKHPPYTALGAGLPTDGYQNGADTWCDVEIRQFKNGADAYPTNTLYINHTLILSFANTNIYTSGTIMLGYENPSPNSGDANPGSTAAAYFSNVRVVELAPGILAEPTNLSVDTGSNAAFSVVGVGTAPFTNIWYYRSSNTNTVALSTNIATTSTNNATLDLTAVTPTNAGSYYVVVSDLAGSITSSVATLTVFSPPVLVNPLVSVTNSVGSTASFLVQITGTPPSSFSYLWSFTPTGSTNVAALINVTTPGLTLTNIQPTNAGTYSVVVSNILGSVSSSATLTVTAAQRLAPSFTNSVVLSGGNVVLTFTSSNGTDTTNSFTLQSATAVIGPWVNDTNAVFTNTTGAFQVTLPTNGSTEFFRLEHN